MSTSLKVRDTDKRRLDRLQAVLTTRWGRKVSQQDVVALLLGLAEARSDELRPEPPGQGGLERLLALPVPTGVKTREEEIDDTLYGTP